jgi:hypothetical protein
MPPKDVEVYFRNLWPVAGVELCEGAKAARKTALHHYLSCCPILPFDLIFTPLTVELRVPIYHPGLFFCRSFAACRYIAIGLSEQHKD